MDSFSSKLRQIPTWNFWKMHVRQVAAALCIIISGFQDNISLIFFSKMTYFKKRNRDIKVLISAPKMTLVSAPDGYWNEYSTIVIYALVNGYLEPDLKSSPCLTTLYTVTLGQAHGKCYSKINNSFLEHWIGKWLIKAIPVFILK